MRNDIRVVQTFVDSMVGVPKFSYPSRQTNAPRPKSFAHVTLIEEYIVGIPAQRIVLQTKASTQYRTDSLARLRFRIGVIEAPGAASKIAHGWTSEAMKVLMIQSGYGFIKCFTLSNEDAKLENEWEYRQGFGLELYVTRTAFETVDNIEVLEFDGAFYDETKTEIYLGKFIINN